MSNVRGRWNSWCAINRRYWVVEPAERTSRDWSSGRILGLFSSTSLLWLIKSNCMFLNGLTLSQIFPPYFIYDITGSSNNCRVHYAIKFIPRVCKKATISSALLNQTVTWGWRLSSLGKLPDHAGGLEVVIHRKECKDDQATMTKSNRIITGEALLSGLTLSRSVGECLKLNNFEVWLSWKGKSWTKDCADRLCVFFLPLCGVRKLE